jgi:hypothetical protein
MESGFAVTTRASRLASVMVWCLAGGLVATAFVLLMVPADYVSIWRLSPEGAQRFRETFPVTAGVPVLDRETFTWLLRAAFLFVWLAWAVAVAMAVRGAVARLQTVRLLVGGVALVLAVFAPVVLSGDVFGYVAYGRLAAVHGLNPYEHGRTALDQLGDPAAAFLVWPTPLPYGPAWTLIAMAISRVGGLFGLHGEVVGHRALAAAALVVTAVAGARLAERREPGRGTVAFLAIGLNPLFVLEGPATGHNDFAMLAALVIGAAAAAGGRWRRAALAVGVAIAVKPVAVFAAPLFAIERWRRADASARWRAAALSVLLMALPTSILSIAFGGPLVLIRAVAARAEANRSGFWGIAAVAIFLVVLVRAVRSMERLPAQFPAAWLNAWMPVAAALVVLGHRSWFPWYASWVFVPALTGWDKRHGMYIAVVSMTTLFLVWVYTMAPP